MKLYHGTSDKHIENIQKEGLRNPYVTDSLSLAAYYAEVECEDVGGQPLIVTVEIKEENLRYDYPAMDEPVGYDEFTSEELEERVQEKWNQLEMEHPEWIKNNYLIIPKEKYQLSLDLVGSCQHEGIVLPHQILKVQ